MNGFRSNVAFTFILRHYSEAMRSRFYPELCAKFKRMGASDVRCYSNKFTKEFPELSADEVSQDEEEVDEPVDEEEVAAGMGYVTRHPNVFLMHFNTLLMHP
jgi:hypothetical protein